MLLVLLPLLVGAVCLGMGRYSISFMETLRLVWDTMRGQTVDGMSYSVVFNVRIPRIILALLVGAGLACSGTAFQGIFSNALVTPDTLGVASGASFGAVLALLVHSNLFLVQVMALIFGMTACYLTYSISKINGKSTPIMIILSGMVVSALFQAFVSIVKYLADPQDKLPAITYWLMGSMASANYRTLLLGIPFILIGLGIIYVLRWRINILSLNEDEAKALGVHVRNMRIAIILASSMITASCVSMCGQVGWVGLLIPHIARMLFGSDNKVVVPVSVSFGGIFMLLMDTTARSLIASEIPLSVLTSVIGAPVFIFLLRKTGGGWS